MLVWKRFLWAWGSEPESPWNLYIVWMASWPAKFHACISISEVMLEEQRTRCWVHSIGSCRNTETECCHPNVVASNSFLEGRCDSHLRVFIPPHLITVQYPLNKCSCSCFCLCVCAFACGREPAGSNRNYLAIPRESTFPSNLFIHEYTQFQATCTDLADHFQSPSLLFPLPRRLCFWSWLFVSRIRPNIPGWISTKLIVRMGNWPSQNH